MNSSIYNFCAGPAMLPAAVMRQAQQEYLNWQNLGCSVMELSHRSDAFMTLAEQAENDLRALLQISEDYQVLFCHGGGRAQFAAVPLNLSKVGQKADFLVSGSWSDGAVCEANKYLVANVVANRYSDEAGLTSVTPQQDWQLSNDACYFHYCPNETVDGVEIDSPIDFPDVPVVADMSSTILSKPLDINRFGVIYAGAQKNIGPSGLSVVIVRNDLLDRARRETPSFMHYKVLAENQSMYNTPPTFAWYLAGLVFKWLLEQGGVDAMAERNAQKAALLYQAIDHNDFYYNKVAPEYRSRMNVPFHLVDEKLEATFLSESQEAGLLALKGHRSVGGMRASIYNAMPLEGVRALTDFMQYFSKRYG